MLETGAPLVWFNAAHLYSWGLSSKDGYNRSWGLQLCRTEGVSSWWHQEAAAFCLYGEWEWLKPVNSFLLLNILSLCLSPHYWVLNLCSFFPPRDPHTNIILDTHTTVQWSAGSWRITKICVKIGNLPDTQLSEKYTDRLRSFILSLTAGTFFWPIASSVHLQTIYAVPQAGGSSLCMLGCLVQGYAAGATDSFLWAWFCRLNKGEDDSFLLCLGIFLRVSFVTTRQPSLAVLSW